MTILVLRFTTDCQACDSPRGDTHKYILYTRGYGADHAFSPINLCVYGQLLSHGINFQENYKNVSKRHTGILLNYFLRNLI